jgi:hypothetical protein
MDYQIAIPSYKRPETIKNKTLKLLMDHNIDKNKIIIFVADNDEEKIYKQSLGNEYKIVVGVHTIGNQRNFIERYYNENTRVVMFDDDLDGVFVKNENNLDPIDNIENDLIINGFNECIKNNSYVFGVYAAANAYFMLNRIYTKLCYIPGGVFGVIIQHDDFLQRKTNHGEDYEYSIRQYIKNKIVVRFDYITIKSKFFKEQGGLQTIRTKQYIYDSIKWIQDEFPEYCKMYIRKSSGNAELRLKDNSKQIDINQQTLF